MDENAINIIKDFIRKVHRDAHVRETLNDDVEEIIDQVIAKTEIRIVWKVKVLQNWKYIISTSIENHPSLFYELTYNGDNKEWYLDAYRKIKNEVIPDEV